MADLKFVIKSSVARADHIHFCRKEGKWLRQTRRAFGEHTFVHACNGTTKAKQKRLTENAEPHVGCTNKPGDERGEWSAIETSASGLYAHAHTHTRLQTRTMLLRVRESVVACGLATK